ncbi:VWA domain-containing protein [Ectothiorhodospiraceae bacterium 2226]|nr:VWA domain-containing protein [Ectothiorhodospiraceae bacterium 2226]
MNALTFAAPGWLWLLPLALLPLLSVLRERPVEAGATWLRHPDAAGLASAARAPGSRPLAALRVLALALLLVALAQPRTPGAFLPEPATGHDLVLVVDTSGSMLVRDYEVQGRGVSRLEVLQGVVTRFVRAREHDRFALITFADEAGTLVPLTEDRELVVRMLARLRTGVVGDDTAIGDGLALALKQFAARALAPNPSDASARIPLILLFSDGENNAGLVRPAEALALARAAGVALYTVEITGAAQLEPPEDEPSLAELAAASGGRYFHAASTRDLEAVVAAIGAQAEARPSDSGERVWRGWYPVPLLGAMLALTLASLLAARRPA